MRSPLTVLALVAVAAGSCPALHAGAVRKAVEFEIVQDVGFGNEVYVSGTHPDLGGGNILRAPKLAWNTGNVWRGMIALPAGESVDYQFVYRPMGVSDWGNSTKKTSMGSPRTTHVPAHSPAPWGNKVVLLQAPWNEAFILYRDISGNGTWTESGMIREGPGRTVGESVFRAEGLAPSGAEMEFVFRNASNVYLNAPAPPFTSGGSPAVPVPYQSLTPPYNFRTTLDVFFVQDGQIFNYRPPAQVGPPRAEVRQVASTVSGIPGRPVTIRLPRGYDQNTSKRYPVVYFHDGQNIFYPGGPFGTWDADRIADYETSQGRMREAILVAIPNGNEYGSDRLQEYLPDGDTISNYGGGSVTHNGRASQYLQFLLDNVAPTLDVNFRTLGNAENTFVAGSSMGGLVSDYIVRVQSDRFGGAGIFSPAFWAAPNYESSRESAGKLPVRRFLSMGTAESSAGESSSTVYWQDALAAYNTYLRLGHTIGADLSFEGVPGGAHNEAAWSALLPRALAFLLNPWREAQPLSLEVSPPVLGIQSANPSTGSISLQLTLHHGMTHSIETAESLAGNWVPVGPSATTSDPWETVEQTVNWTAPSTQFWRLRVVGW